MDDDPPLDSMLDMPGEDMDASMDLGFETRAPAAAPLSDSFTLSDCAVTEPLHLVEDRAKGELCVGFARFLHTNGGVMAKASIERPRDMAGTRIQYPGAPGKGVRAGGCLLQSREGPRDRGR